MTRRWALLAVLASASCTVPLDPQGAQSIPTEIALQKLQQLLPTATYVSCMDPRVTVEQAEIEAWSLDKTGLQFKSRSREEPFKLTWELCRGVELIKVPLLRFEVRVFATVPDNPRKDLFHFNWKEEDPARKAAELFEALRADR